MPIWAGPGSTPEEQKQLQEFMAQQPGIVGPTVLIPIGPTPQTFGLSTSQIEQLKGSSSLVEAQQLAQGWGVSDANLATMIQTGALGDIQWTEAFGAVAALPPETPLDTVPEVVSGVTLGLTQDELNRIQEAETSGLCVGAMQTYYTPKTYTITLRDGSEITVEALSKDAAKNKAEEAGYKVAWVGWSPSEMKDVSLQGEAGKKEDVAGIPWTEYTSALSPNEFDKAVDQLTPYKDEVGGYNVMDAVSDAQKDPKLMDALVGLFGATNIATVQDVLADNVLLPDGLLMKKTDFESIPKRYQDVLIENGWVAYEELVGKTAGEN